MSKLNNKPLAKKFLSPWQNLCYQLSHPAMGNIAVCLVAAESASPYQHRSLSLPQDSLIESSLGYHSDGRTPHPWGGISSSVHLPWLTSYQHRPRPRPTDEDRPQPGSEDQSYPSRPQSQAVDSKLSSIQSRPGSLHLIPSRSSFGVLPRHSRFLLVELLVLTCFT